MPVEREESLSAEYCSAINHVNIEDFGFAQLNNDTLYQVFNFRKTPLPTNPGVWLFTASSARDICLLYIFYDIKCVLSAAYLRKA